ncbi:MAG: hypothetical protein GEU82_17105 [Luteitalea sp.]|nr:hypothetical protein [Luteitalea sp.]
MFNLLLAPTNAALREQLAIVPHHRDRLRRPAPSPGAIEDERFRQALAWNVFRTLELLPPAFWLRRLQARLHIDVFPAAPQTVLVGLWRPLTLPLAQHVDGPRPDVVADVTIETEHAVWTLTLSGDDLRRVESESAKEDSSARLIDAMSWHAGTRDCYFGVISSRPRHQDAGVALVERYFRSRESLQLRSASRVNLLANVKGIGSIRWTDLAAILGDCERAAALMEIERTLARNAVTWLERVGIA